MLELSSMNTPVCPIENVRVSDAWELIIRIVRTRKIVRQIPLKFFIEPPDYSVKWCELGDAVCPEK
jgi:hypothetical protein